MPWVIAGFVLFLAFAARGKKLTPAEQAISDRMKAPPYTTTQGVNEELLILQREYPLMYRPVVAALSGGPAIPIEIVQTIDSSFPLIAQTLRMAGYR